MSELEMNTEEKPTPVVKNPIKRSVARKPKAKKVAPAPVPEEKLKRDVRPPDDEIMLIVSKTVVDKFNTICKRVELTPAVCEICGFDVCERNNLGDYYDMDAETQERVRKHLSDHIAAAHSHSSQHIISKSELPTAWLGKSVEEKEATKKKIKRG